MRTRSQNWAQAAYERVRARKDWEKREEYQDMALKLPVLVRQAGLSQALAFVHSRGKEGHRAVGDDLAAVLGYGNLEALAEAARRAELLRYLRLTREVLQVAEWFKRFAQALLED
ncbi:type III-B CRISPR module-associated protein Cmr5 [Thermus sp.]|uniref:type III-B CRISPR module-associated protein Cmr5 n=1 Tax=Thermus sp. TaxID=275 RepID=UPI0025D42D6B|nr:type III-B CRISPR module-associated protein Cmr5 [Thermus sp.]MCS6869151.1 type III-B CRISPR module-associated protein Cmr5 [Thermus sp.]MCX7850803.1 type III-B CRISPR module-associated protein Cmr5 [Thermus sp.]MDW8358555.1 type III-B CRISPR module-associated protein Cmr5 [Thermus sp.]